MNLQTIDLDKLSKPDAKTARVIMAKANIPKVRIMDDFIAFFGEKYNKEKDSFRISRVFLMRQMDDEILADLETFSKSFNK